MIIYENQRKILKLFIKNTDEYIEKDDLNGLLFALFIFTMVYGFNEKRGRLNLLGRKLDKLYDEILEQNRNS